MLNVCGVTALICAKAHEKINHLQKSSLDALLWPLKAWNLQCWWAKVQAVKATSAWEVNKNLRFCAAQSLACIFFAKSPSCGSNPHWVPCCGNAKPKLCDFLARGRAKSRRWMLWLEGKTLNIECRCCYSLFSCRGNGKHQLFCKKSSLGALLWPLKDWLTAYIRMDRQNDGSSQNPKWLDKQNEPPFWVM